jgi:hypothetical protein
MEQINSPYVKIYENGVITNPIEERYASPFKNRRARRENTGRQFSNKKGIQLVITPIGIGSYIKTIKKIISKKGGALINYIIKK